MPQRVSCIFNIPQHSRDDHDSESDPEKDEEASKISIITSWIEVRHSGSVLDCREHPVLLLRSDLLASRRNGLG